MELQNKIAIITGGARGIGSAVVKRLNEMGAHIIIADILEKEGTELAKSLTKSEVEVRFIHTDMKDIQSIIRMVDHTVKIYGKVDILVNNAGVLCDDILLEDISDDLWHHVIDINLNAVFQCSKYVLRHMREQQSGSIVNVASLSGLVASSMDPPYVASKSGVVGLTRSIAYDYGKFGIRCNAVCPGVTMTAMVENYLNSMTKMDAEDTMNRFIRLVPMGRIGQAEEIAEAIAFLASPRASFITGVALPVDGGQYAV